MAPLKTKGDLAELKVATDLLERGYRIAIPYGEDHDFDLILCRDDRLERVQVKYTESNGKLRDRSDSVPFTDEWKGEAHQVLHVGNCGLDRRLRQEH